ncbi:MAG: tail fiber domain-containing protein [Candidatus Kapaibacterium sp.]|nr:tail fiber domain-containing protein [Ignavibacteria bacterium]
MMRVMREAGKAIGTLGFLLPLFLLTLHLESRGQNIPEQFSYQGILVDKDGIVYPDGNYQLTFRLYEQPVGGTPLWEETFQVILSQGVFDAILGETLPFDISFDRKYWFGITLAGEVEMSPRLPLLSVPYALSALTAQRAENISPSATGLVRSLNGLQGDLSIRGEGDVSISVVEDTISIAALFERLPQGNQSGEVMRWNNGTRTWEPGEITVTTSPRIFGDGSSTAPLDIAKMGAIDGQVLTWDEGAEIWRPGTIEQNERPVISTAPIVGDGSTNDPLRIAEGKNRGEMLFWNGTLWVSTGGGSPQDGNQLIWDDGVGQWRPGQRSISVSTTPRLRGDGSATSPLDIAQAGATEGQVLRWNNSLGIWLPADLLVVQSPPLIGAGTNDQPLRLAPGSNAGNILFWTGTQWSVSTAPAAVEGDVLQWNGGTERWEPSGLEVTNRAPLSRGSIWVGDAGGRAQQLGIGQANQVLRVNSTGTAPEWSSALRLDSINTGDLHVRNNTTIDGDLTVSGTNVNLPNGSIDNAELANSSVNLSYGTGLSGDASVPLGGTLNVQNTGVISASAGAGINVSNTNGAITIENTGLLSANAGAGIDVTTTNGAATIANTGVLSLAGTSNQVNVDQATGAVTLSLPQAIHTDATPTFDGLTLDNINTSSTANQIVVSNNGSIESRSFVSLFPGGLLPQGSNTNATLRWNGTAWVENVGLSADASGNTTIANDLTVSGANVNLPNGSIDNGELANSSVNVNYGAGLSGDASVILGGTINLQNTGVTSANAGTGITLNQATGGITITNNGVTGLTAGNGINIDQATGNVTVTNNGILSAAAGTGINVSNTNGAITIDNTGLLSANAGTGIDVTTTSGAATIANTGVLSLSGTPNQVDVDQATGAITLSLPQDIHSNATPTFDGLTLDNISIASTANQIVVSNNGSIESRSFTSLLPGGLLPQGNSVGATLRWDGTAWVENIGLTSDGSGNVSTTGNTTVGEDLTVSGTNVNLPNGSIDNAELANSSVNLSYGTGLSGDASVALGGTLNLQNSGVTSASAGNGIAVNQATGGITITNNGVTGLTAGNGINIDQATGNVTVTNNGILSAAAGTGINVSNTNGAITIENTGLLSANAGTGINVTTTNGVATIANSGVLSLTGTANQINVDQATGAITLSLPQNIHTDATPTFDGLTLDNLNTSSTANQIVVSNNGSIESRSFTSLFPGGLLPQGSNTNATLRWNGTVWVENIGLSADASGNATVANDLTVGGTNVTLPNGSIDNAELANSSVNLSYGTGLSGDASVALGGTLNVQNTGVTSASAGAGIAVDQATGEITITNSGVTGLTAGNGITLDQATGNVTVTNNGILSASAGNGINVSSTNGAITIENTGLLSANAGTGIDVTTTNGAATIANTGVLSLSGTADQINVDQATGTITLSLPQDIHSNATPTFDGLSLDNINTASTANQIIVSNNGSIESRSFNSLLPGGLLPQGNSVSATLRWDGTAWVENTGLSADAFGNATVANDLTVSGTNVNLPNGSIDNAELANSSVNLSYGTGLSGDASVVLGGTLNVQNSGVTSLSGATNQVNVDQATGAITLSLPQDIHTNATPTFDGLTLDNLTTGSSSTDILVSNNGTVEERTFASLLTNLPLTQNAIFVGNGSNVAAELSTTNSPGALLQQNNSGSPIWTPLTTLVSAVSDSLGGEIWLTSGNAGTTPALDFIGTTDNQQLTFRVNSAIAMRYVPDAVGPTIIGGHSLNFVGTTSSASVVGGGVNNRIENNNTHAVIGGGLLNRIIDTSAFAVISGGRSHQIDSSQFGAISGGSFNRILRSLSGVIGGGTSNLVDSASNGTVAGGGGNQIITSISSSILGGTSNRIRHNAQSGVIVGGQTNLIDSSQFSSIVGGRLNYIRPGSNFSVIAGNDRDTIDASPSSTISGGALNVIRNISNNSTIGGGVINRIDSSFQSTIAGGRSISIKRSSTASVGGGFNNQIDSSSTSTIGGGSSQIILNSLTSTIAGGGGNQIRKLSANSTISGGSVNIIDSSQTSVIGGGRFHVIANNSTVGTIAGGDRDSIDNSTNATIGGGTTNRIRKQSSIATISGGFNNQIDSSSRGTVSGGLNNTIRISSVGVIGGGSDNLIDTSVVATIGGGANNLISFSPGSVLGGGSGSRIERSTSAVIAGGGTGQSLTVSSFATISGGKTIIIDSSDFATVSGGTTNSLRKSTSATIGGGSTNSIQGTTNGTIGGGFGNQLFKATNSTIGGGNQNKIDSTTQIGTIGGGALHYIGGLAATSSNVIAGGQQDSITNSTSATIAGGANNIIDSSNSAAILGGSFNRITSGAIHSSILGGRGLVLGGQKSVGYHGNNGLGTTDITVANSNVAFFGNVDMWLGNNRSQASKLIFFEAQSGTGTFPGTTTFFSSFEAGNQTDTIRYILPTTAGTAGDVLEIAGVVGDVVTLEWDTDDNSSDARFKQNIRTLTGALDSTLMLRGVRHDWRRGEFPNRNFPEGESIGFIAQEVEKVFPELVKTESDGFKKVEYAKVTALLVEALREEHLKNEAQEERLDQLEQENKELQEALREILARLRENEEKDMNLSSTEKIGE